MKKAPPTPAPHEGSGVPEGASFDVDFGDDAPTAPAINGSKLHPADAEWEPPLPEIEKPRRALAPIGRTLPVSVEAEEYLLSCMLLDGKDVVSRCREAGITIDTWYESKHGIIYDCICSCVDRGLPVDVSIVAEELKTTKQLDKVGGYAFLTQVSARIPTTAQTGYFIEKVREQALLRETIRCSAGMAEECYNFSGGIDTFLEDLQAKFKRIVDRSIVSDPEQIEARRFNHKRLVKKPTPIFSLAGTTVSTPGNLTAIYSQAKTGKSSLVGAMIAAAMTNPTSGHDTLGITGPNYEKGALIHFDTEQSDYDWQQLITSSLKRVGLVEEPKWLMSYHLTGMSAAECRAFISATVKRAQRMFGKIHSIFIDGIADLVIDPNDPAECFPLITELHAIAIKYNTAIISILHMNPGSEVKGRGHLGSQLERKAESNLTLEKNENEVTRIRAIKQRGKTIPRDKEPSFKWSDEHQMHRACATPGTEEAKSRKNTGEKYSFSEFKNAFPGKNDPPKTLHEVHRIAASSVPIKLENFYNVVKRYVRDGMILEHDVPGQKKTYQLSL
jgi:hypothetical protein